MHQGILYVRLRPGDGDPGGPVFGSYKNLFNMPELSLQYRF